MLLTRHPGKSQRIVIHQMNLQGTNIVSDKMVPEHESMQALQLPSTLAETGRLNELIDDPELIRMLSQSMLTTIIKQMAAMAAKAAALQVRREASKVQVRKDDIQAFAQNMSNKAPRFLDNKAAARYLSLSPRTLEKFRVHGGGPLYRKFGRRVLYAIQDLEIYANSHRRTNTSQNSQ
jgi:hypothetical protein